jgi:hypothetical protein
MIGQARCLTWLRAKGKFRQAEKRSAFRRMQPQSRPWRDVFFTVNLLERRSRILVEHIDGFPAGLRAKGRCTHTAEGCSRGFVGHCPTPAKRYPLASGYAPCKGFAFPPYADAVTNISTACSRLSSTSGILPSTCSTPSTFTLAVTPSALLCVTTIRYIVSRYR